METMTRLPPGSPDVGRRARAGALLQMALDQRHLPEFLPGEPSGMAGVATAARLVRPFLEDLAALYGVRRWTPEEFVRAYVDGALASWQPGLQAERSGSRLRLVSPICPIAGEAELDPRACQLCRAFQAEAARLAAGATLHHEDLITRGEGACVMEVQLPRPRSQ